MGSESEKEKLGKEGGYVEEEEEGGRGGGEEEATAIRVNHVRVVGRKEALNEGKKRIVGRVSQSQRLTAKINC